MYITLSEISVVKLIHFYSENPPEPIDVYLDNITLYKPGENIPPLSEAFRQKSQDKVSFQLKTHRQRAEKILAQIDTQGLPGSQRNFLESRRNSYRKMFELNIQDELDRLELIGNIRSQSLLKSSRAIRQFELNRKKFALTDQHGDVTLGFASAAEKVLPRAAGFNPLPEVISLSAARNEHESFQLIVLPTGHDLKAVKVLPPQIKGFPKNAVKVLPVGYVETKFVPPHGSKYVGFWPDLLLGFLDEVKVKSGDAQAFWVRFSVPEDQTPGKYHGTFDIEIDGIATFRVPIELQVRNFTLPKTAQLPIIASFGHGTPNIIPAEKCKEWEKNPLFPPISWKRHREEWVDMLADYLITFDFLYGHSNWHPDFDSLKRLKAEGKLGVFNLGFFGPASNNPANLYGMQSTVDRIRKNYDEAKFLGLLKHAYIYGCDEVFAKDFPRVERAGAILKKAFPDVLLLTTTYDHSFGESGEIKSIDAFCPLTPQFVPEKARAARKNGKQVWWYICCGPHPPYANIFVESDALEGRLLMGAMTAKYRPDGFLYYRINNWNNPLPVTTGPFTDWNPNSFTRYNGDGSLTAVGPDGTPLATIRLENFRDGLEDYAYVKILEERLAQANPNSIWAKEARAALDIPPTLVKNLNNYTKDPLELFKWRSRIAELIEGVPKK